ncbi:MAG: glycoside hydrolase family 3 N-terminal domain-containing protein, partial [Anaerolineaceae bacterium]|nr:glycoside hydrolase family 3 N-terminal domain-containing protein [Anaerolineaceae bacterium]
MKFNPCRWVAAGLLLAIVVAMLAPVRTANAVVSTQPSTPEQKAKVLLDRLSPREKVGQLFLVTFKGRQIGNETQIYELIVNRRVGGVVFRSANDNFTGPNDTLAEAYRLTTELQTTVFESSQIEIRDPLTRQSFNPQYIPLFIAVSQEGDGYPHDQILNGTTLLPNLMAIGATWKAELAQAVGAVMGKELQALGFNLYLGPSLDVL